MNFLDEFKEARRDFLQESWDKYLVEGWRNYPNANMAKTMGSFKVKYKITDEEALTLKRMPKTKFQFTTSVSRFIAAYLPKLNTHLWNDNKSFDELVEICGLHDSLKYPVDSYDKEVRQLRYDQIKYRKSMVERALDSVVYNDQKRSNWSVAKGRPRGKR